MNSFGPLLQSLYQDHINLMSYPAEVYANGEQKYQPPFISSDIMIKILDYGVSVVAHDPILMNVKGPVHIVGDLHGHLFDLYNN